MNVKISKKGKALLRNIPLSFEVVKAISSDSDMKLYSEEGLKVKYKNRILTIKMAKMK